MTRTWTEADVRALPVTVDLVTAGSVLGMGRTAAYEAQRRGQFPVPVLQLGSRFRVCTAHLRALLGLEAPTAAEARGLPALRAVP